MAELIIRGGQPLDGKTAIQGAKNSALPILAACALTKDTCVLRNVPHLTDVDASAAILRHAGAAVTRGPDALSVTAGSITNADVPDELMQAMRSSVLFAGPLLGRTGHAAFSLPGGCELGPRPVDLHLAAFAALGAKVDVRGGHIVCRGKLRGGAVRLSYPSVGATENALMAAVLARGESVISGAACEPEIMELADFLRALGAKIAGDGTPVIHVLGVPALHGAEHTIRPDRIVTATYLCAAAAAGGEAYLSGARPEQLRPVIGSLRQAGADISEEPGGLRIRAGALHAPGPIVTAPYPGFPTDAQAPVMAALLRAEGRTEIRETVFSARFSHVPELRRLGGNIELDGQTAHVRGVAALHGTHLRAEDLRGGAAAVIGALGAAGESRVTGLSHLDRGYEDIARDLTALGAAVARTDAAGHTN